MGDWMVGWMGEWKGKEDGQIDDGWVGVNPVNQQCVMLPILVA